MGESANDPIHMARLCGRPVNPIEIDKNATPSINPRQNVGHKKAGDGLLGRDPVNDQND